MNYTQCDRCHKTIDILRRFKLNLSEALSGTEYFLMVGWQSIDLCLSCFDSLEEWFKGTIK